MPFFVIDGVPAFSRAQRPETFVAAFRQVLDMDASKCGPDTLPEADDNIESAISVERRS